jgi:spermidine synthase
MAGVLVQRLQGHCGELVLRRDGEHFEIIANGVFLMDTRGGTSERLMVSAAADRMPAGGRMLIGGLGVGFSLAEALAQRRIADVTVVEREPAVISWARGPMAAVHGNALDDPRVRCVEADLVTCLAHGDDRYDAICLDVDNGPQWTVTEGNGVLYTDSGLDMISRRLAPDGVLAVWSAASAPRFASRLRNRFDDVEALAVPVPRGEPDVVYLARRPVGS